MPLLKFIFLLLLSGYGGFATAQGRAPEIRNLSAAADTVSGQIHISYDLIDPDSPEVEVILRASNDHGRNWILYTHDVSGDIGKSVRPGKQKNIIWYYNKKAGNARDFQIKLIADDGAVADFTPLVQSVDENRIRESVKLLEQPRHYLHGADGLKTAKKLLTDRLAECTPDVRKQSFMLGSYEGHNISGRMPGQVNELETIMVIAHYDTHPDSPGANDNASGVATMLETAKILSTYNFRKNIVFVGVDLQKQGGIGVKRYLQKIPDSQVKNIKAVYNLDNIGVFESKSNTQKFTQRQQKMFAHLSGDLEKTSWKGDFLFAISDLQSENAGSSFVEMAAKYTPQLKIADLKTAGKGSEEYLFGNGTYQDFWNRGIPAVLITDGAESRNPNYETRGDVAKHLNIPATTHVARALAATLAQEAEMIHGDIKTCPVELKVVIKQPPPVIDGLVDYHLYLTDNDKVLKVRINHPKHGRLFLKLMDTRQEVYYQSRIDLYYESVINIDISYLDAGVYLVNLSGAHFDELKEFILP